MTITPALTAVVCSLLFVAKITADDHDETSIIQQMEKHQVVPDVIRTVPEQLLEVRYGNYKVDLGNVLTPTLVRFMPSVVSWNADPDTYYALCLVDPDAPSRKNPKNRLWMHWLVVNILGTDVPAGEQIFNYIGAAPPKKSGLHRYVFLVYKQPIKLEFDEERISHTSTTHRAKYSIEDFALKYDLGDPIAGNFFQAEWDEYCEIVYRQLSGN